MLKLTKTFGIVKATNENTAWKSNHGAKIDEHIEE